jgi:hypothetical protein
MPLPLASPASSIPWACPSSALGQRVGGNWYAWSGCVFSDEFPMEYILISTAKCHLGFGPLPLTGGYEAQNAFCWIAGKQANLSTESLFAPEAASGVWVGTQRSDSGETAARQAIDRLHEVVASIQQGRSLTSPSSEYEAALRNAARAQGAPSDVEAWAQRLVRDISDLSD